MTGPETNLILSAISPKLRELLETHFRSVDLRPDDPIAERDEAISRVLFPHSGMISYVVEMSDGSKIETAMLGRNGIINAGAALDGGTSLVTAFVQVAGQASAIEAKQFAQLVFAEPELLAWAIRHEQVLLAQTQQASGCHILHDAEARLCRWLAQLRDITGSNHLGLTQEFLAQMLGVQRASVSIIAGDLQRRGLIRYSRGSIEILNADDVRAGACECYEVIRGHGRHLLPH